MGTDFRRIADFLAQGPCGVLAPALFWGSVSACNVSPDLSMSGQACEQRDCEKRGVYLSATIAATVAEIRSFQIEVCKNDTCVVSQLADSTGWSCDALGPIATTCSITPIQPVPSGSAQVEVHVTGRDSDFVDGDHFTIKIGVPNMAPRLFVDRYVNPYETALPSGPLCPLRCRYAVLAI